MQTAMSMMLGKIDYIKQLSAKLGTPLQQCQDMTAADMCVCDAGSGC